MEQTVIVQGATFTHLLEKIDLIVSHRVEKALKEAIIQQKSYRYMSRVEVANMLKISLPTLNDWTKLGWLTSYKIAKRVLYRSDEVEASLHKRKY